MENEYINKIQKKHYKYKGENFLIHKISDTSNYENIYMCGYTINNTGKVPFQRFLLINSLSNRMLAFPTVKLFKKFNEEYTNELINYVKVCFFKLFNLDDFVEFNSKLEFKGVYEYDNNLYVFLDCTYCVYSITDTYRDNTLWFVTIAEILNTKYVCDMPIRENITNFFIQNEKFCFLVDENNKNYDIPIVCYIAKREQNINFTYIFGQTTSDKNAIFGPYYYFKNLNSAVKDCEKLLDGNHDNYQIKDIENMKVGLIRFIIFPGTIKYVENNPLDNIDESQMKKLRIEDSNLNINYELLTMRISDHDGKWSKTYDSIILGKIELDDGNYIEEPIIAVKEYSQQIPLSYHYVNTHKLKYEKQFTIL
jgi:hypothetical protein